MKTTAQHPYLLSLFNQYKNETQPFRKVHRMIDLFESIIKTHTVVILAEYVKHNKLSDSAKGLLAQGLRTPSLGTWQLFSRVLFEELQKDNYTWLLPDFASEFSALDKALNDEKTNVISFRNGYAHGATPSDLQCENDIKKFDPFLNLLLACSWLNQSSMEVLDGKVMLASSNEKLSLHPMLLYRKEEDDASFAFFNDLKNDKIGLLNYPLSKHYREKDFFTEFHEHLPLNEWKKVGNNEFYQRIEELTETFKGRTLERNKLLQFVLQNRKGYFSIQGNPGIGKSALIAQFFKDLRAHEETKKLHVIEYFIRRGTNQAQVEYLFNYLIRRTDEVFAAGKEIRAEGKMVFDLQNQLFTKWRLWGEQGNGQQLLFLIDGLDEGVENNVVNYLPRENFENILIIYGSRPGGHKSIDDLWGQLPVLNHTILELSGLGIEDIRALIYEVANKYELERESTWIDAVQKRSQGNPLYLKLLCDAIENGSIALNDIDALPKEIDEYYKAILQRYAYDVVDGDALLAGLFTFAAAKDYLTMGHLGLINKLGDATIQRIGSTLKEVLYENPLTEDVLDYQLFHESFREYLIKEKPLKVNEAAERIIDFCGNWQALEGTWEQRYTLEHYATHLSESKKEARGELLMNLLYDTPYAAAQKKVLKNFDASNRFYQTILLKANDMQRFDVQLEAALCLVDLKYEEANDAPQVIEMITHGEIDLALKRIESFGGEDEDGLRRKFILYMLCLMELTLLESKNKPFRKAAIEKLLQHLDEQLPVDHSILKWNDFFPSYTIYQMACEWAELELDYRIVFKRTADWDKDWIREKGPYNEMQFNVLIECATGITNESKKSTAMKEISTELTKQGKLKEALKYANGISDDSEKISSLNCIFSELVKQGNITGAISVMRNAIEYAHGIIDEHDKNSELTTISISLAKQNLLEEALECVQGISNNYDKKEAIGEMSREMLEQNLLKGALKCARLSNNHFTIQSISIKLAKQGEFSEALECLNETKFDKIGSETLKEISTEMAKQGKVEEAIEHARNIFDLSEKSRALMLISTELSFLGQVKEAASVMQEALECAREIDVDWWKCRILKDISAEMAKQSRFEEASATMLESIKCAKGCFELEMERALIFISTELAVQGQIEKALEYAREINGDRDRINALMAIFAELEIQGKKKEAALVAQEARDFILVIPNKKDKNNLLDGISKELAKQGNIAEARNCANKITDKSDKIWLLKNISSDLAKQGKYSDALACASELEYESDKSKVILGISIEKAKQGSIDEAISYSLGISVELDKSHANEAISKILANYSRHSEVANMMLGALVSKRGINDDKDWSRLLSEISIELVKQGKTEKALECTKNIHIDFAKYLVLKNISIELTKKGEIELASSMILDALDCAREIPEKSDKSKALKDISSEMAKQGKLKEALDCARGISDYFEMSQALMLISTDLYLLGELEEADSVFQEALEFTRKIYNGFNKFSSLKDISNELWIQGKQKEATSVMQEAVDCALGLFHQSDKSGAMRDISTALIKQGKIEEAESAMKKALEYAQGVGVFNWEYSTLEEISTELAKQGNFEAALKCARGISSESFMSSALWEIANLISKQGNLQFAEQIGFEIDQLYYRHGCWKGIGESSVKETGWKSSLEKLNAFKSEEAQLFYLKGWSEYLSTSETGKECLLQALPLLAKDSQSIENLLQKHALHEVFLGNSSKEKINRLNRSLNIQWALDIVANFPKETEAAYHSSNVETWIQEIEDENDREDILGWAEKVSLGKMTEEKFQERIQRMI